MTKRSYGQLCSIAAALDVLGERWTLLLVRELLGGPRRFSDVLDGLPGIGTGLLTARLRELEAAGVVERVRLARPATGTGYALTEEGRALEPVVLALADWGASRLAAPGPGLAVRARWAMLGLRTRFDATAAAGVRETYEFRVDDEVFHARVDDGSLEVGDGRAADPDVVLEADGEAFARLIGDPANARGIRLSGPATAKRHLATVFPAPAH